MTETEWLTCTDPHRLLYGGCAGLTPRRLCLVAAAFARCAARLVPPERMTPALGRLEGMDEPDGTPTEHGGAVLAITAVSRLLAEAATRLARADYSHQCTPDPSLVTAVSDVGVLARIANAAVRAGQGRPVKAARVRERQQQRRLLREVAGNPFRPVAFDRSWLSSTVVALATGIHQDRAFDRLPILADALEDAGCDNAEVLDHCRGSGPHVRGCHVLDLILGKS